MKKTARLNWLWLFFWFSIAVLVRVYKVADIPYGIHVDEAGMGYDAWSLQKYHVDRWLNRFPVYFTNFGGGQSALQAYLCAIFIRIFGHGEPDVIWFRMPGILLNIAGYLAGLHIIRKVFGKKWEMFSAFILAILPYFIMQCRFGLDCNLLVNMMTISLCSLSLALEYKKRWIFILTGILWGITYYTYALSYIPNTVFLIFLTIYLLRKNKSFLTDMLCIWISAAVIAFPLVLFLLINQFDLPQMQLGFITITKLPEYRGGEFVFDLEVILKNIGVVLSSILAKDWIDYNAFDKYYVMYQISIPFIVIGFFDCAKYSVANIKNKKEDVNFSVFLWMVYTIYFVFGCFLGGNYANVNKMNGIFFAEFFLLICGIRAIYFWIRERNRIFPKMFMGLLCLVYLLDFVSFSKYYFGEYRDDMYPQFLFDGTYAGILQYLEENELNDRQVCVIGSSQPYIYYLLSSKRNPYELDLLDNGTSKFGNISEASSVCVKHICLPHGI